MHTDTPSGTGVLGPVFILRGYRFNFKNNIIFFLSRLIYAAFHLDLHCISQYPFLKWLIILFRCQKNKFPIHQ